MSVKPGDRKHHILQALAGMLDNPNAIKITTTALAAKLNINKSTIYRHFSNKAQIFEGLIEFIERTLFTFINGLIKEEKSGIKQVEGILLILMNFARKNPGITRLLTGDVLTKEDGRLQSRINQLHDRLEASIKQALRFAVTEHEISANIDIAAHANLLMCYTIGRWHQFIKSGFKRDPLAYWETQRQALLPKQAY